MRYDRRNQAVYGAERTITCGLVRFAAAAVAVLALAAPAGAHINPVVADDPGGSPCANGDWFRDGRGDFYFCSGGVWVWLGQ